MKINQHTERLLLKNVIEVEKFPSSKYEFAIA
jgi:hypothetical protein